MGKLLLRERKIEKLVREGKMDKVMLKEARSAKKSKKREKEKLKSRVASVIDNVKITRTIQMPGSSPRAREYQSYLPSASDYSDLDSAGGSPDRLISVISRTDKAGTLRSDTLAGNTSAKHRLGERREHHVNLLRDDREREVSDDENYHEAKRKIAGSRREKSGKQTYAARVLGDLKLVKENRDLKGVKSEVTGDMKRRLGEKVKQITEYNEDDPKRLKIKRKGRSDSPVKSKSRKIEKSKSSKSNKKSSKRSLEVDDESSDDEKYKNLKNTKSAKTSPDLHKSGSKLNIHNSSKDYSPIKNRKIKLKKKKGSEDMSDVSSLLALDTSQEGADRGEPDGDILKQLD